MANQKTIKFNGSKVSFQKTTTAVGVAVTSLSATNPATLQATGLNAVKGDVIVITGASGFDGAYVVASVSSDTLTLAGVDWTGKQVPTSYANVKVAKAVFSDGFCALKSFQKSGASIEQVDVSTICSTDGKEYEAGDREEGSITMGFWLAPNSDVQSLLEDYEMSGDKFFTRLDLAGGKGSYLFYGNVETGLNIDGQVNGRWDSGITIKVSGRRVFVGAE